MVHLNKSKIAQQIQVENLLVFVILFLIIAITLGLNSEILQDIKDTQENKISNDGNDTITLGVNNTAIVLIQSDLVSGSEKVWNGTNLLTNGNYTMNYTFGLFYLNNVSNVVFTDKLNVSYDHYYGSPQKNITQYGLNTQNTLAKWIPTIVLVVIVAVIVGILMFYLVRKYATQ